MATTLLHAPLACSLAVRFAAAEGNVPLDIVHVNLQTKECEDGTSLYDINPLGQVSVLRVEGGEIITETSTVLLWLQAHSRSAQFRRAASDPNYFQMLRWVAFCTTELHKQIFTVVFYQEATDAVKDRIRALAPARLELRDRQLSNRSYLLGERFSAADAYLTWCFVLGERAGLNASPYAHLEAYQKRVMQHPLIRDLIETDTRKREEMYGEAG